MAKPNLISGVQPSGKLHIGNYLGALKNFVELQDSCRYDCYFFVADLHSLTEDFDPKEKPKQVMDVVLSFLAAGIDPKKSKIFIQSQTSEPAELAWILNTITPFGELGRMTQFKEKAGVATIKRVELATRILAPLNEEAEKGYINTIREISNEKFNVGLFDYPVLMAADILLYDASFVPVGEDQLQHLEFTRTIARKFNSRFGETFTEPKPVMTSTPRLMSLDNPEKKMSKSQPSGCLFLDDSPEEIREKIMKAVTDSDKGVKYDEKKKPAVSNLMKIYEAFSGEPIKSIETKFKGKGYGVFKTNLAEVIIGGLAPFQKKKQEFAKQMPKVESMVKEGAIKARSLAGEKLKEVKKKIGLI